MKAALTNYKNIAHLPGARRLLVADSISGEPVPLGSESEYPRVATAVVDSAARMFISGTDDGMVWERDPVTGKRIGVPMPGISFDVLVRSDGGAVFATGSRDGDIAQYA